MNVCLCCCLLSLHANKLTGETLNTISDSQYNSDKAKRVELGIKILNMRTIVIKRSFIHSINFHVCYLHQISSVSCHHLGSALRGQFLARVTSSRTRAPLADRRNERRCSQICGTFSWILSSYAAVNSLKCYSRTIYTARCLWMRPNACKVITRELSCRSL